MESGCDHRVFACRLQRLCCSVLPLCVWLLCCAAGITPGISGILAAPVDGTEMTVLIMHPPALTPCDFCDLKWHKREITWVRQQGKKSHITQCRLGWTISPWAVWGFSTQTWRSVSPDQVWAGFGGWNSSLEELRNICWLTVQTTEELAIVTVILTRCVCVWILRRCFYFSRLAFRCSWEACARVTGGCWPVTRTWSPLWENLIYM